MTMAGCRAVVLLLLLSFVTTASLIFLPTAGAARLAPLQTTDLESAMKQLLDYLSGAIATIYAITFGVILLGWITGNLMWAAPTHSMIVKRAGKSQIEISGISLFLVLVGPAIFWLLFEIAAVIIGG